MNKRIKRMNAMHVVLHVVINYQGEKMWQGIVC